MSLADRDLKQYAGKKIRIGFYHWHDTLYSYASLGWYIDDVRLTLPVSIQVINPNTNPAIILNDIGGKAAENKHNTPRYHSHKECCQCNNRSFTTQFSSLPKS